MTTWYISTKGKDTNSGTSMQVYSSGTDGARSAGNTFSASSASWSAADIGRGINIGGTVRIIVTVPTSTSLTYSGASLGSTGSSISWTVGGAWNNFNTFFAANIIAPVTAAGDIIYVAPGRYIPTNGIVVTVGWANGSVGNPVKFIGDITGEFTGEAPGPVEIHGDLTSQDSLRTWTNSSGLWQISKGWWEIKNLCFYGPSFTFSTGANNCLIYNCGFFKTNVSINGTGTNIVFDSCIFATYQNGLVITLDTSATADYDSGCVIKNSYFLGCALGCTISGNGAASFKGGGVTVKQNTFIANTTWLQVQTNVSATFPVKVVNNLVLWSKHVTGSYHMVVQSTNGCFEDYNAVENGAGTPPAALIRGGHSKNVLGSYAYSMGQETIWGGRLRMLGTPLERSPILSIPTDTTVTSLSDLDFFGLPRGSGSTILVEPSTVTSLINSTTISDTTKNFPINSLSKYCLYIISGAGAGQFKDIISNTATNIVVNGNFAISPNNTSTYVVLDAIWETMGLVTSSTSTVLTDSTATFKTAAAFAGLNLIMVTGAASGEVVRVTGHTNTALTVTPGFINTPSAGDIYHLYSGTTPSVITPTVGASERKFSAVVESTVVNDSPSSIKLNGFSTQDFKVPVNTVPTQISIKCRHNSAHSSLPEMELLPAGYLGVSGQVIPSPSSTPDVWHTLTSSSFTANKKGWITVRLKAKSSNLLGLAYFDTLTVS
jgi:hypothetical protein